MLQPEPRSYRADNEAPGSLLLGKLVWDFHAARVPALSVRRLRSGYTAWCVEIGELGRGDKGSERERENESCDGQSEHAQAVDPECLTGEPRTDVRCRRAHEVDDHAYVRS